MKDVEAAQSGTNGFLDLEEYTGTKKFCRLSGFQSDEFLFIELGRHPAFGYMELPPMNEGIV